jgi:uncharacterized membrane protein
VSAPYNQYSGRSIARVQALADGVFAVAMTLLVLDVRLPGAGAADSHALWSELTDLGPNLAAYLLSFTMLGTFWLALHAVLDLCKESDRTLAWAVLAFLFFVTTLPFTASVLADHTRLWLAVILYWLNLLALGVTLAWAVVHAGSGLVAREQSDGRRSYVDGWSSPSRCTPLQRWSSSSARSRASWPLRSSSCSSWCHHARPCGSELAGSTPDSSGSPQGGRSIATAWATPSR